MSGPTLDPAGLSHAVVFPALEEECCVPVPVKRNEEQEVTIHNSRIPYRDSEGYDVFEDRSPEVPDRRVHCRPVARAQAGEGLEMLMVRYGY